MWILKNGMMMQQVSKAIRIEFCYWVDSDRFFGSIVYNAFDLKMVD